MTNRPDLKPRTAMRDRCALEAPVPGNVPDREAKVVQFGVVQFGFAAGGAVARRIGVD